MSKLWNSKCCQWTSRFCISWGILFKWQMSALPQADNQNLRLNNISAWFLIWLLFSFHFSKISHLPSLPQASSGEPVSPAPPCLGEHCRDLSPPWEMPSSPSHRWEMTWEDALQIWRKVSAAGDLASWEQVAWTPGSTGLSRFQVPRTVPWSQFWLRLICFLHQMSWGCHTRLGWDNLAKPVLVPFSGLDCEAFCSPVGNFLMKNSEIQILPGLSWWCSYPSTFIHSFSNMSSSIVKGFW